ncbi:MAG: hypothetical protein NTZ80_00275 [Patescibacteria group bacterium]|nr:hypothetical protein [Patescibacteria group bacterium]
MPSTIIINNSDLQKNIGMFSKNIESNSYTVINRGKPKMIILPYFEDSNNFIDDYLEAYEINKNRKNLQQELTESLKSGESDLII